MNVTNILAGALLLTSSVFAGTISYGTGGVKVTIGTQPASSDTFELFSKTDSAKSDPTKDAYQWWMVWNLDSTLSWAFIPTTGGFYLVEFFIPVIGGPFDQIFNSAGYTVNGVKGSAPAGITGFQVNALVGGTTAKGLNQPAGFVDVADATFVSGKVTRADDNTNNGSFGPFVAFGPQAATNIGVRIRFNAILPAGSSVEVGGTLSVGQFTPPVPGSVPEPATFGLIGAALLALGAIARRGV